MIVRTLQSLTTPRGNISAGRTISMPETLVARLAGKVVTVPDCAPFRGAVEMIMPDGGKVWLATESEAEKLIPTDAIYFTAEEIMRLQKVGRHAANAALMVKMVFPGAVVELCSIVQDARKC